MRKAKQFFTCHTCFALLLLFSLQEPVYAQETIAYYPHVAPILAEHCTPCHQPGGAGPMPFTNYEEAAAYGAMIAYVTKTRYMPPWRADMDYSHFETPLSLSEGKIDTIQRWLQSGFPQGPSVSPNQQIPAEADEEQQSWDLELDMDTAFEQYDIYFDQFQVFRLPTGLAEDRWVKAIEFIPGDASIVRYVSVSLNQAGPAGRLDAWDPRYGYTSFGGPGFVPEVEGWFTWAVGDDRYRNDGTLRYLPAGAELIMYVHYGPTGEKKLDRSKLRLKFAEAADDLPIRHSLSLINPTLLPAKRLHLPAGQLTTLQVSQLLPERAKLHSIEPRGLLLTRSWEVFARLPNGYVQPLLKISDYDMHWRRAYDLPKPVDLPAGSTIHARAVYDNRADNPFIPVSPPLTAQWGWRLYEEQFSLCLGLVFPDNPGVRQRPGPANQIGPLRTVNLPVGTSDSITVKVERISGESITRNFYFSPVDSAQGKVEVDLKALPFGNYRLSIFDSAGRNLAREYFVYWPPEMAKSILDE